MPSYEGGQPTLVTIAYDIHIKICTFLHPSDILALRKTCKVLQLATKQRIIWMKALHRICLDNTLFLPSFPVPDMSDVELERAAMAPHRWIELCTTFSKQHSRGFGVVCPTRTRTMQDPLTSTQMRDDHTSAFFVPGGRYFVRYSPRGIGVWDLGYTPDADCKLLASVGPDRGTDSCTVIATSDGMGLIIVAFPHTIPGSHLSIYEIYPQNESPLLTEVAKFDFTTQLDPKDFNYVLHNKLIWYTCNQVANRVVFTIWDYRLNHSTNFTASIDASGRQFLRAFQDFKTIITPTTIIVLYDNQILVWGFPPLSHRAPESLDHNPSHRPPLFRLSLPNILMSENRFLSWETVSEWYSASSQSIYIGVLLFRNLKLVNFEIVTKPDLSDISLHAIKPFQLTDEDISPMLGDAYVICEDTLVSASTSDYHLWHPDPFIIYIRPMASRSPNVVLAEPPILLRVSPSGSHLHFPSSCSGRVVHLDIKNQRIVVDDFFPRFQQKVSSYTRIGLAAVSLLRDLYISAWLVLTRSVSRRSR